MKRVGFWLDPDLLPPRVPGMSPGVQAFVTLLAAGIQHANGNGFLTDPLKCVDATWVGPERDAVIAHLRAGRVVERYLGDSWCRFKCGASGEVMGCADLTDDTYVWPEGYVHYLEEHHLKPPQEFIAHVLKRRAP